VLIGEGVEGQSLTFFAQSATGLKKQNKKIPITHSKTINYQLKITNYQIQITNYQLPIIEYQLSITICLR